MDIAKMRLPKLQSFCCCLPLSTGLLVWGYASLVYHILLLFVVAILAFFALISLGYGGGVPVSDIILIFPLGLLCLCGYNLAVIIAGHLKKVKLVRNTFIAGAVIWTLQVLYSLCLASRIIIMNNETPNRSPEGFGFCLIPIILEPVVQGYVLLTLRSFMLQLQDEEHIVECSNLNRNEVETGNERFFTQIR